MKRAVLILAVLLATSCSPKIVDRVVVQRDTIQVHHRDSVFRRDSVYIREWVKGDTVFVEKYRDRLVWRDRWRDSVVVKRDSVTVDRIKEVKVEQPLPWRKRVKIAAFWWLVAALAALAAWTLRKPLAGFVTKILKTIF